MSLVRSGLLCLWQGQTFWETGSQVQGRGRYTDLSSVQVGAHTRGKMRVRQRGVDSNLLGSVHVPAGMVIGAGLSPVSLVRVNILGGRKAAGSEGDQALQYAPGADQKENGNYEIS